MAITSLRLSKTIVSRKCLYFNECGRKEEYNGKEWNENWYKYEDGYICKQHKNKLFYNKLRTPEQRKKINDKWNPIYNLKNNPKHLRFKNQVKVLKQRILTGRCERCKKKVGDEYINCFGEKAVIKQTHTHHYAEYHEDDVRKDTIELCASCHIKETWRLKKLNK